MITVDDLKEICPFSPLSTLGKYVDPLNAAMQEFEINNVLRETMFLAQVAHESGGFHYVEEIASGAAYEGRADLGNTEPGDGIRFKGRGLIQVTGRANYAACGSALGIDLVSNPPLLESPDNAARSAAWFWQSHGLNELADKGVDYFVAITKRINGGTNGLPDRQAYLARAQTVIT